MGVLGLHFSQPYKEKLLSGEKRHTIVDYEAHFQIGQKINVYCSDFPNLFDGTEETRIGTATIRKVFIFTIDALTPAELDFLGYESKEQMLEKLSRWYEIDGKTPLSYVAFDFEELNL